MLIREAEIPGGSRVDVRLRDGCIRQLGRTLELAPGEPALDACGGALLPGLHDHHIHLLSLAAARRSVSLDPRDVRDGDDLAAALRAASPREGWIRGVGYHDSVAGPLDRRRLDAFLADRPALRVRVQHRSGSLWILNSAGLAALGVREEQLPRGAERDAEGRLTGRLFRLDGWLRERLPPEAVPDLGAISRDLAALGVTGVTDATPGNGRRELALLSDAIDRGAWRQRLRLMGGDDLAIPPRAGIDLGPRKILLDERELPDFDDLAAGIRSSHAAGRPVAIHCVTRAELALACAAVKEAGALAGDRIEHASVAPPDLAAMVADLCLTVVTQPHFVFERGDEYLSDVDAPDQPWLYRCEGWLDAGVPLGGGTDAPFGAADPWLAMRAAVDRRTRAGQRIGAKEALSPERALALFTADSGTPGGPIREVAVGGEADLCLLDRPWAAAREELSGDRVRATWVGGELVWQRGDPGS